MRTTSVLTASRRTIRCVYAVATFAVSALSSCTGMIGSDGEDALGDPRQDAAGAPSVSADGGRDAVAADSGGKPEGGSDSTISSASCASPFGPSDAEGAAACELTQSGPYTLVETPVVDAAACPMVTVMFPFSTDAGVCGPPAHCTCAHAEAKCTVISTDDGMTTTVVTDYTYTTTGYTGTLSSTTTEADGSVLASCNYTVKATI
jgi:hypothetical protein